MNAAPCSFCVGHLLHVHSSLLHCPLPTLFVSSICFFYAILEMSSIKIKFSPAWHSIIGLHEVFLPLPWSQYRVSVLVMLYQLSFARDTSLARCSGVSHDVLVVTARAYYVSPLVRRAFLHQSILFSFVSPLSAGRFSINLVYQSLIMVDNNVLVCGRVFRTIVPLRLIIMDNNVRGHVLLITSDFLSLMPCRI